MLIQLIEGAGNRIKAQKVCKTLLDFNMRSLDKINSFTGECLGVGNESINIHSPNHVAVFAVFR